jgi:hypothetical protein
MPSNLSLHLLPILPVLLIVLLAAVMLGLIVHGSSQLRRKQVPVFWVRTLAALRLAVAVLFVLVLLQPVVSYTRLAEQLPELAILVDTSQSMGLPGGAGKGSRLDEVRTALQEGDMADALGRRFRLHWFTFDSSAHPIEQADLPEVKPVGSSTHFAESLTLARNFLRAAGVTPERVLLVSDGNDLGSRDPVEAARSHGLVIDTLGPGPTSKTPAAGQAQVTDVQCARRVLLGSETHFRVTLRRPTPEGRSRVTLRLAENDKEIWRQPILFPPGSTEQSIPVAHRPGSLGVKRYQFRLEGKGAAKADPYRVNVRVVDAKNEVLILEDTWRWEFKFLRRVFEDDPSFRFTALLARGRGTFVQFGAPDRRVNLVGFPQSRGELEGYDTFVLGDVDPGRWPRGLAAALAQLVSEEGKSLVVIAGPNLARLAEVPELNTLLPVEVTRRSANPVGGPVEVRVSAEGAGSPFFFKPPSTGEPRLPPLDQIYPPLRKRPAATVLLEAAKHANAHGHLIVIAEHTVGRGRVLYVGTDTLWKWQTLARANEPITPYSSFWQQAFRALSPARSSASGVHLWLQPDRSRYRVGQPAVVRAEVQADRPLHRPRLEAAVLLPDGRRGRLEFALDPAHPNRFRADFEPTLPGAHRITATVASEGKIAAEGGTVIEVDRPRAETVDGGVDQANLARIAASTGGRVVDPARPDTWPTSDSARPPVSQTRRLDLWNDYILLLFICGLLGTDWLIRLRRGYM